MGSMLGSCIAATTAFLVVNAGRLGVETLRRFRTGSDPFTVLHGADECNAVKGSDPVHYSLRNTVCGSSVVARRGEPRNRSGSAAFHGTSFDPDWRLYYAARYERRVRSGHRLDSRHRLQALANAIEHLPRNGTDLELDGSTLIADSGADVKE
jgi:hypothetical protein